MEAVGAIIEDIPNVRGWLCDVATRVFPQVEFEDFGTLSEARAHLRSVAATKANLSVALIDLSLPDGSGLDYLRDLLRLFPTATSIVTTIYGDDLHLFEAIASGAQGYLLKSDEPEHFEECLRRIRNGEPPLSPAIARRIMSHFGNRAKPTEVPLTTRETEVLSLLALGMRIRDIAQEAKISEHTARDHVKSIYSKLNISSRAEAALEAARRGLA